MRTTTITSAWTLAGIAGVTLLLAGCGAAPAAGPQEEEASDYLPCLVSDAGGFDDKSFNDSALLGLETAADDLGIESNSVESGSDDDYTPNIDAQIAEGCDLIITVGFRIADATLAAAEANPDLDFAIVDNGLDADGDGAPDVENGKPIVFNTAEAAFLAGYVAAAYSKTGVVGTFGGQPIPPVTLFMDGFVDGVAYFNEQTGAEVKAIGWDKEAQTGSFTGGFAAGVEAKTAAQGLLDQDADVLLPVGGPIYQSAAEAIRDTGGDIAMIGVDADVYETDPTVADLLLTSILKGIDASVRDVVTARADGDFDNSPYVGTLENDGVGIAPFHDFESRVPADLRSRLDELTAAIISGEVEVTSPSTPR